MHRDLKPANILVDESGQPKVLDFGIAKVIADVEQREHDRTRFHTRTGMAPGTYAYMSPEHARGHTEIDARSDVYSLGVILYELLTDCSPLPLGGKSDFEKRRLIIEGEPTPLGDLEPNLAGEVERIVHQALSKRPEERQQTAEEFTRAIRGYLEGSDSHRQTKRRRAGFIPGLSTPRGRRWAIGAMLALFGVLAVVLAPGLLRESSQIEVASVVGAPLESPELLEPATAVMEQEDAQARSGEPLLREAQSTTSGAAGDVAEPVSQEGDVTELAAVEAELSVRRPDRDLESTIERSQQDFEKTFELLRAEAQVGDPESQFRVGEMYYFGRGAAKDYQEAAEWLGMAAEQGHTGAQTTLGYLYATGEGVPQSHSEAVRWFRAAAEQGDPLGQEQLGRSYSEGRGVSKDDSEAVKWFRLAAEQEHASAENYLGIAYSLGKGVPRDDVEALKWYQKAADQGNHDAQANLGKRFYLGQGVRKDSQEAARWFKMAAEGGDVEGQTSLGLLHLHGEGVPLDPTEALRWFRMAGEQGFAEAQYLTGALYASSEDVPRERAEALRWFRRAAEQGHAEAQLMVGFEYSHGDNVPSDMAEAARWFRMAGEQGNAEAQFQLGIMYQLGDGAPKHDEEAARWYRSAAEQGDALGQFRFAESYLLGKGLEIDRREAVRWLNESADQGHVDAQAALGILIVSGDQDVVRDPVRGHMWISLALTRGAALDELAAETAEPLRQLLLTLETSMTAEEISEAQRLAREWSPSIEE